MNINEAASILRPLKSYYEAAKFLDEAINTVVDAEAEVKDLTERSALIREEIAAAQKELEAERGALAKLKAANQAKADEDMRQRNEKAVLWDRNYAKVREAAEAVLAKIRADADAAQAAATTQIEARKGELAALTTRVDDGKRALEVVRAALKKLG